MEDSNLTRKAIEEIVREMHESKFEKLQPTIERKLNPLGRPNKRFLGRTITSILQYNKRANDRSQENCRRKLQELDRQKDRRYHRTTKSRSRSFSSSRDIAKRSKPKEKRSSRKKSERKKRSHKKRKRISSSSSSSSYDDNVTDIKQENITNYFNTDNTTGCLSADSLAMITEISYNRMSHLIHYNNALVHSQLSTNDAHDPHPVKQNNDDNISSSSLSLSENSSDEIDENGMVTIKVSSDSDASPKNSNYSEIIDTISCISLESETDSILSCSTDSLSPERSISRRQTSPELIKETGTEITIDLTDD